MNPLSGPRQQQQKQQQKQKNLRIKKQKNTLEFHSRLIEATEGCLREYKRCPQGLKPVLACVINVRAKARTLQGASSHADSLGPEVRFSFHFPEAAIFSAASLAR